MKLTPAAVFLFWMMASPTIAQLSQPVLVLGAGKAGGWDTSIAITNLDSSPMDVSLGPNLGCGTLGGNCGFYASATIGPFATFVMPSIPDNPGFVGPQAVYVGGSFVQPTPVVSATVADRAGSCERSMTLPGIPLATAFAPGDLVFTGVNRDDERYANLIMAVEPPSGPPYFNEVDVRVSVRDSAGTEVGVATYPVTSQGALVIADFLSGLGILSVDGGSVRLSGARPMSYRFAAVITAVEPTRALAIQGTRVPSP